MINNVFNTTYTKLFNVERNFQDLSKFITHNRSQIYIKENLRSLMKEDRLSVSPIMKLYYEFKELLLDKNNIVALMNLGNVTASEIPQLLIMTHIDPDMLEIKDINKKCYDVISTYPEFHNKVLVNITSLYDPINHKIRNIAEFGSRIVKDIFCRSYILSRQTGKWNIPNSILEQLIEMYAWIISYNISRVYNLTYTDQKIVAIILAIYFTQKCFNEEGKFIPLYKQIRRFGSIAEINAIESKIIDTLNGEKELTIEDTINLITTLGPEHISELNIQVFFKMCRAFHIDNTLSLTSIEYPPLWLYNIITAISGENKSNTYWSLQKTGLLKIAKDMVKKIERGVMFDYVFKN